MASWVPLESNPDVLSKYIHTLGVSENWSLLDVYGLDPELLAFVPKPVKAVILLCPCSENYEKHSKELDEKLNKNPETIPNDLFYMKQCITNACGAIALVHSIANNPDIELDDGSVLGNYLETARSLTAEERGELLENHCDFTSLHKQLAPEGQTEASAEDQVAYHFIAFVNHANNLYELDGRKVGPVNHGSTSTETFLEDAAKICKSIMALDPDDLRYSVIALGPTQ